MLVSRNVLVSLVPLLDQMTLEQIKDALMNLGVEVESITQIEEIKNLVVGRILEVKPSPQSKEHWICSVQTDKDRIDTIISTASNIEKKSLVIVAKVGCVLPNGTKIETRTIKGMPSEGMLCRLSDVYKFDASIEETLDTVYTFDDPDLEPGNENVLELLNLKDTLFDVKITPNRSDLNSHYLIAKHLAFFFNYKFEEPKIKKPRYRFSNWETGEISDKICKFFTGTRIENIEVEPTPSWLANFLMKFSIRPFNFLVDLAAYTTILTGCPLFVYDASKVKEDVFISRSPKESFEISGETYKTHKDDFFVRTNTHLLSLAGVAVMDNFKVNAETKSVLVESSVYATDLIKQTTARTFSTNQSVMFHRQVPLFLAKKSLAIFLGLVRQSFESAKIGRTITYVASEISKHKYIQLPYSRIQRYLTEDINLWQSRTAFKRFKFKIWWGWNSFKIKAPSYRLDVYNWWDLIEELIFAVGINQVEPRMMRGLIKPGKKPNQLFDKFHRLMIANDFMETVNYNLTSPDSEKYFNDFFKIEDDSRYELSNPIGVSRSVLRANLMPQLLKNVETNLNNNNTNVSLYEISRLEVERSRYVRFAGIATGEKYNNDLSKNRIVVDYYYMKAVCDQITSLTSEKLKIQPHNGEYQFLHPTNALIYLVNEEPVGWMGELHPDVLSSDAKPTFGFEFKISRFRRSYASYEPLNRTPQVRRDFSFTIKSEPFLLGPILNSIKQISYVSSVIPIDFYRPKDEINLPSVTLKVMLSAETTLNEAQINEAVKKINSVITNSGGKIK